MYCKQYYGKNKNNHHAWWQKYEYYSSDIGTVTSVRSKKIL
jgi:hypothetical protein